MPSIFIAIVNHSKGFYLKVINCILQYKVYNTWKVQNSFILFNDKYRINFGKRQTFCNYIKCISFLSQSCNLIPCYILIYLWLILFFKRENIVHTRNQSFHVLQIKTQSNFSTSKWISSTLFLLSWQDLKQIWLR